MLGQTVVPDNEAKIIEAIKSYLDMEAGLVLCTGGMSVDPDDLTAGAIKKAGGEIVAHGVPVLPGSTSVSYTHLDVYKRQVCQSEDRLNRYEQSESAVRCQGLPVR